MADGQTVTTEFVHHGVASPFVGIDDHDRALHSSSTVLQREVDRGHGAMAAALQGHALHAFDVRIDDVPAPRVDDRGFMLRKPCRNIGCCSNRMDVRQNGATKSRTHGARRSQNVHVNEALDGGKQGNHGSAVTGWSRKKKDAVHVRKHERWSVHVSLLEAFRDVPRDQARMKPTGRRFHLCDGFSKGTQARIVVPSRLLQTFLSQAVMQPEQALGSSNAPRGGRQQEGTRFGQGVARFIQREQVKRGVGVCLGKANVRAEVTQKASKRGDARCINPATVPCHATHVMAALAFCRADDENGFSGHRLLHPRWEWAEGNDLEGRHAPKTPSGFLNTLRGVDDAASKGLTVHV